MRAFCVTVAEAGATVMLAMVTGGGAMSSLQTPNVFAAEVLQVPEPVRPSDSLTGPLPFSETPMSVEVIPLAAPPTAATGW